MSYDPRIDEALFGILNHDGSIEKFLDTMFSFLYRRTDFFTVKNDSSERLGFLPGVAQKMVKVICQRYVQQEKAKNMSSNTSEPSPAKVRNETAKTKEKLAQEEKVKDNAGKGDSTAQDTKTEKSTKNADNEEKLVKAASEDKEKLVKAASEDEEKLEKAASEDEEKPVETEDRERRYYDSNPESYNGASYDNYSFAQDICSLEVRVKVPNGVKSGDQVKVTIKRTHLTVEVLHEEKWQVVLDGVLSYEVRKEESTWTLHPHDHVYIQLEKNYERYWESLLEGEPKINVRAIDCSKPYEDLGQEEQAKLQEMMFDQHQKMLGKPTSKQIQVQDILKQAWDKKDSPFKGQKFDPGLFNVSE